MNGHAKDDRDVQGRVGSPRRYAAYMLMYLRRWNSEISSERPAPAGTVRLKNNKKEPKRIP